MGWIYDTQIIQHTERATYKGFTWDGNYYYLTPTGRTKRQTQDGKLEKVTEEFYNEVWNQYQEVFDDK